jgi:hypothetical protein
MGTPSLSVSSTPGMSVEKKKMSTEEDCSDDTRDKLKGQFLYLMQGNPIGTLYNTIYLYRKSTVKSLQLIIGEGAA